MSRPRAMSEGVLSDPPRTPTNKARCLYIAWAFFGEQPFGIAELEQRIKQYGLWHSVPPKSEAEAKGGLVMVSSGQSLPMLRTMVSTLHKEAGLFQTDPNTQNTYQIIPEKAKAYLSGFPFPGLPEWLHEIRGGPSIALPALRLRGKAFTAGGPSALADARSVSPPILPQKAASVPSTPERELRTPTIVLTKPSVGPRII